MNISDMKELDHLTVDMLADAFGGINCKCSDFSGKIECAYSPIEDKWLVRNEVPGEERIPRRLLREAETIHEEMVKKEYHKMYKNPAKIPNCTGIIQRDRATIVTWDDNTKTTIVAEKDVKKNDYMMFEAFCIAFTKKMLGSTTNILKTIEENDTDKQNQLLKEAEKNFRKQRDLVQKEEERIRRETKFNEMVEEEFMRMRAAKEAKARYNKYIHKNKTNKKE